VEFEADAADLSAGSALKPRFIRGHSGGIKNLDGVSVIKNLL